MSFVALSCAALVLRLAPAQGPSSTPTAPAVAVPSAPSNAPSLDPLRDRSATFTLKDGRIVVATLIARGANGHVVAVGPDVVTLNDDEITSFRLDIAAAGAAARLASLDARVTALAEARPGPRSSPIDIAVGDSPVLGARDAPVTVVAFIDLLSPSSVHVVPLLRAMVEDARLKGRVRVVVKQRPIVTTPTARDVARLMLAVHAIAGDVAYFKLASGIAANIDGATPLAVLVAAEQVGVGREVLGSTVRRDVAALDARIDEDLALATRAEAHRSPTIFVDGWRLDQLDIEGLLALLARYG